MVTTLWWLSTYKVCRRHWTVWRLSEKARRDTVGTRSDWLTSLDWPGQTRRHGATLSPTVRLPSDLIRIVTLHLYLCYLHTHIAALSVISAFEHICLYLSYIPNIYCLYIYIFSREKWISSFLTPKFILISITFYLCPYLNKIQIRVWTRCEISWIVKIEVAAKWGLESIDWEEGGDQSDSLRCQGERWQRWRHVEQVKRDCHIVYSANNSVKRNLLLPSRTVTWLEIVRVTVKDVGWEQEHEDKEVIKYSPSSSRSSCFMFRVSCLLSLFSPSLIVQ